MILKLAFASREPQKEIVPIIVKKIRCIAKVFGIFCIIQMSEWKDNVNFSFKILKAVKFRVYFTQFGKDVQENS